MAAAETLGGTKHAVFIPTEINNLVSTKVFNPVHSLALIAGL